MANLIGDMLGSYRILEQIGIGGMATVYKAYQPAMDRYVAIKVIAPHFAQHQTFLQRFRREARAVARLEHAHILPVYDYGEAEDWPYLVMRYLEAGTLNDRITQGPLSLREVSRIIAQVGSALDYAHRMGVIHRDVKPANVLLDAEGDAFLTDFGVAKMVESSVQLTGTGVGIGTPAYMSPEQGRGRRVDSRTDIYSLGVMLFEMVTGQKPYEADTPLALVQKHIGEPLPLPRSVRSGLPEEVERVILRAMAKDPGDRFQTAGGMVQALDAAVQAAEADARATLATPTPASGVRVRGIPFWAWGLLGAMVVLALVAASLIQGLDGLATATPIHIQTQATVTSQPARTLTPTPMDTAAVATPVIQQSTSRPIAPSPVVQSLCPDYVARGKVQEWSIGTADVPTVQQYVDLFNESRVYPRGNFNAGDTIPAGVLVATNLDEKGSSRWSQFPVIAIVHSGGWGLFETTAEYIAPSPGACISIVP